jgi:uncharacterized membrane protein
MKAAGPARLAGPVRVGVNAIDNMPAATPMFVHLFAALLALPVGAAVLLRRKGDRAHRMLGRYWVALMAIAALTSFWIPAFGQFSWIHLLTLLTLFSLAMAVWRIRRGDRRSHRGFMIGAYNAEAGAFIGAVMPGRLLGTMFWG